jgi:hypothetical protein
MLDRRFKLAQPPTQFRFDHQFEVIAQITHAPVDLLDSLLHASDIVDSLERERPDVGQLPSHGPHLVEGLLTNLRQESEIDSFSHRLRAAMLLGASFILLSG